MEINSRKSLKFNMQAKNIILRIFIRCRTLHQIVRAEITIKISNLNFPHLRVLKVQAKIQKNQFQKSFACSKKQREYKNVKEEIQKMYLKTFVRHF